MENNNQFIMDFLSERVGKSIVAYLNNANLDALTWNDLVHILQKKKKNDDSSSFSLGQHDLEKIFQSMCDPQSLSPLVAEILGFETPLFDVSAPINLHYAFELLVREQMSKWLVFDFPMHECEHVLFNIIECTYYRFLEDRLKRISTRSQDETKYVADMFKNLFPKILLRIVLDRHKPGAPEEEEEEELALDNEQEDEDEADEEEKDPFVRNSLLEEIVAELRQEIGFLKNQIQQPGGGGGGIIAATIQQDPPNYPQHPPVYFINDPIAKQQD